MLKTGFDEINSQKHWLLIFCFLSDITGGPIFHSLSPSGVSLRQAPPGTTSDKGLSDVNNFSREVKPFCPSPGAWSGRAERCFWRRVNRPIPLLSFKESFITFGIFSNTIISFCVFSVLTVCWKEIAWGCSYVFRVFSDFSHYQSESNWVSSFQ